MKIINDKAAAEKFILDRMFSLLSFGAPEVYSTLASAQRLMQSGYLDFTEDQIAIMEELRALFFDLYRAGLEDAVALEGLGFKSPFSPSL